VAIVSRPCWDELHPRSLIRSILATAFPVYLGGPLLFHSGEGLVLYERSQLRPHLLALISKCLLVDREPVEELPSDK